MPESFWLESFKRQCEKIFAESRAVREQLQATRAQVTVTRAELRAAIQDLQRVRRVSHRPFERRSVPPGK